MTAASLVEPHVVWCPNGTYQVVLVGRVLATLDTNAEAWAWIDEHTDEGRADIERFRRIGRAFSCEGL